MESIVLGLNDGELHNYISDLNMKASPLVEIALDSIVFFQNTTNMKSALTNPYMGVPNERYFFYERFTPPFKEMGVQARLYATYYNIHAQAFEPFIEPWQVEFESSQHENISIVKNKVVSD